MGEHRILCCKVHTWSKWLSWIFIVAHSILLCREAIEAYDLWLSRPSDELVTIYGCNRTKTQQSDSDAADDKWETRVLFLGLQTIENILELFMAIILLLGSMMRERKYLKSWVIFAGLIIFWHIILTILRESIVGDTINKVMENFVELIFIVSLYGFVMWIVGILIHEIAVEQRRVKSLESSKRKHNTKT